LVSSIFVLELSKLTIDNIKLFCAQGFSEGLRIEYKRDFPENLKLAETVCAFANTEGGIILIGVQAERAKNTPTAIPGIELKRGLEEKVISLCLSHISPTIAPEVKVCDFKSDSRKNVSDRAVVLIRVRSSYIAPHYLLKSNKISVRVHNRNSLADLRTIESLINRRERVISEGAPSSVFYDKKEISVENEAFESVVIAPQFPPEPFIRFYSKEDSDWLSEVANEVLRLYEHRPETWRLILVGLNSSEQKTRYCSIERGGKIVFQRRANVEKNEYFLFTSIAFLIKALKAVQKIYSHFGFYGDLSVGLTIVNTQNLRLGFLSQGRRHRYLERYRCDRGWISVFKTLRYDELSHLDKKIAEIFQELCIYFGAVFPKKTTMDIVQEIFSSLK